MKRRIIALVVALVVVGYVAVEGQCDVRSKFCVIDIATTHSELGYEWDSHSFYVSSY